ncbi:MAG: hypothetical protein KME16_07990 [Scytolyngbya sp. HA4215-MV1]|nr:hypothetical protein [Scytolyngbya sp. HA4215-MV1]
MGKPSKPLQVLSEPGNLLLSDENGMDERSPAPLTINDSPDKVVLPIPPPDSYACDLR